MSTPTNNKSNVQSPTMADSMPNAKTNTLAPSINAKRKASIEISDVATKKKNPKLPKLKNQVSMSNTLAGQRADGIFHLTSIKHTVIVLYGTF